MRGSIRSGERNPPNEFAKPSDRLRDEHHGRAIGDDLAHRLADLGRVEAHHDDRVRSHFDRATLQPVDGVAACVFEKHMREWSSQTFRNFEVLIHDDASRTAVEEERVRKLLPEIPLTVVRSETRNGSAAARAALLARARGSILAWQNEDVEEVEALLPANSTSKTRRTLFLEALVHARLNTIRRAKPAQ